MMVLWTMAVWPNVDPAMLVGEVEVALEVLGKVSMVAATQRMRQTTNAPKGQALTAGLEEVASVLSDKAIVRKRLCAQRGCAQQVCAQQAWQS